MDLVIQLVIGGVIGWLASIVMKTNAQMGIVGNVVVGIIGAALGGWLAGVLGLTVNSAAAAWIMAVAGAAVLILLLKMLGVLR